MIISILLLVIFIAVAFAIWSEGTWSGLIMLLNVLLAASLATAWYEWVAAWLEPRVSSYTYVLDVIALQGLFALLLLVFRETTDRVSRTRVRFRKPVELAGAPIVALLTAWVTVCFMAASLHTAPLPRDLIQPTPEARMFFGLSPDRRWLAWVHAVTAKGPFARPDHAFDPEADFILRYADRRKALEAADGLRVRSR
jgi:hypothetical protein